eukprot:TRINITY_DN1785_c0_g1_i4.p1 TRINITY_DN1785_c0_g1~~TRINITY_DN1785_c0_g1_i4.p1  ORF type:complete len:417 (+),score=98.56 TRINITY_DN1785_c0_g1_i4:166-1416(+)
MEMNPNVIWGIVLLVVICIIFPPVMYYQYVQRNSKFFSQRSHLLAMIQHLGMFLSSVLLISYMMRYPTRDCLHSMWVHYSVFYLFTPCMWLRCGIFALRYQITQMRRHNATGSRVLRLVFALSKPFKMKLLGAIMGTTLIIPIIFSILDGATPEGECTYNAAQNYVVIAILITFVLSLIVTVIILIRSKDALYIKHELLASTIVWVLAIVFFLIPSAAKFSYYLPLYAVVVIAYIAHFLISGVWISFKNRRYLRITEDFHDDADLVELLRNKKFRNAFTSFLCLMLCYENLSFYDAVQSYKLAPDSEKAKTICKRYIATGSEFEVNISHQLQVNILEEMAHDRATPEIFDAASNEILSLMKYHSYPLFLKRARESSTEEKSEDSGGLDSASSSVAGYDAPAAPAGGPSISITVEME